MTNNKVQQYVDYFRQLAIRHTLIKHNPASETGNAPAKEKHFSKWNLNEMLAGLRTTISFPAMLIELFEIETHSSIAYDVKFRLKGAFTILQHVKEGDFNSEEEAYALTLSIAEDILKQIWQDHYGPGIERCETPFYQFDFNKLDITSTGKILQNEMGWRVEFSFEFNNANSLTIPPDPGTFKEPNYTVLGDSKIYLATSSTGTLLLTNPL